MNFDKIKNEKGEINNPYAGKLNGNWFKGTIDVDFLNENFGEYKTATKMKEATESEGLKLFFDYLAEKGHIPK